MNTSRRRHIMAAFRPAKRTSMALIALGVLALLFSLPSVHVRVAAAPAGSTHYPDLQTILPLTSFSIGQPTPTSRELRYTHRTSNLGDGPLEVRLQYDPATDTARAFQRIYTHNGSSQWALAQELPVVGTFQYHPLHGHYHFPLARFGLYQVAADGSLGAQILQSGKVGFCLGDSVLIDGSLPHAGTFGYAGAACSDPTQIEGISVAWADEYDSADAGQSIDITTLPDGTYWFRAMSDPFNYFAETNDSNNITDVQLQITGTNVTVIAGPFQPNSQPPTVTMTAPAGGTVSGSSVVVSATAADPSGITSLQFLLDGSPIGPALSAAPFTIAWNSTTTGDGTHYVSAQATGGSTFVGTAPAVVVNVSNSAPPPPPAGSLAVDKVVSVNATTATATTPQFSTSTTGDLLIAFVGADGPSTQTQAAVISGAGLTWNPVIRANTRLGVSEIWQARATAQLTNVTVTSTLAFGGFHQSLTVVAFSGAAGIGGTGAAGAASGAPAVSVTTTQVGSLVYGSGNDWDGAVARVIGTGQTMVNQWVDTSTGDTYWVQALSEPTPTAAAVVQLNDMSPTTDQWNFAAVEITPVISTPPALTISNVLVTDRRSSSATVTWTTNVPASGRVDYGLTSAYDASVSDPTLGTTHQIPLVGLQPETTYHYQITSQDSSGKIAAAGDYIFATAAVSVISCVLTLPAAGASVSGSTLVVADAHSTADIAGVQFLVDSQNLGSEVTGATFSISWNTTGWSNGSHTVSAIARDPTGNTAIAPPVTVTVNNATVPNVVGQPQSAVAGILAGAGLVQGTVTNQSSATVPAGNVISQNPIANAIVLPGTAVNIVVSSGPPLSPSVDKVVFADGAGTQTTPAFDTAGPGEVLVAFAASDGPGSPQTLTIAGAGLTWTLVKRANAQRGTAEIWRAAATTQLSNVTVRSVQGRGGYHQSLTVVAFANASGTGASAAAGKLTGAPTVTLMTTNLNSLVYGVGNDWDRAVPRTLGVGQVMVHQWVDSSVNDTFWVQALAAPVSSSGTAVQLNDTAPTSDRWNFAAVEIVR